MGPYRTVLSWKYNIDEAARSSAGTHRLAGARRRLPAHRRRAHPRLPQTPCGDCRAPGRYPNRYPSCGSDRDGKDRTGTSQRESTPFLIRTQDADGTLADFRARAVIDASGTRESPNPLGQSGLQAPGEAEARRSGFVTSPLPDVVGRDREQFAGRRTLVVGGGHSAANTLLALADLREEAPDTRIGWVIRRADPASVYGGEDQDGLPARGALGARLRRLVETGAIEVHASTTITESAPTVMTQSLLRIDGEPVTLHADRVVPATGFRPDLGFLREIRLDLDPVASSSSSWGRSSTPNITAAGQSHRTVHGCWRIRSRTSTSWV